MKHTLALSSGPQTYTQTWWSDFCWFADFGEWRRVLHTLGLLGGMVALGLVLAWAWGCALVLMESRPLGHLMLGAVMLRAWRRIRR